MKDQFVFISARPNEELFSLYDSVSTLDCTQDMDKNAVTERALKYIDGLSEDDCKKTLRMASKQPITITVIDLPTSFKVRERKELVDSVTTKFKSSFDISKVRWLYFLKVVLNAYYIHLVDENNAEQTNRVGAENDADEGTDNLLRFRISADIVDMFCKNNLEDKAYIEQIIDVMKKRGRKI